LTDSTSGTWHRPTDPHGAFVDGPGLLVAGAADGPLRGRTLAVKDVIDVAGRVTGAGNPVVASLRGPAPTTAPTVARLVAAGATVVGRTVTDELAWSLSGTNVHLGAPVNSAYPGHETGGSSAGSAAAVAAGVVDLALGTDTGGSIRVPASYCRLSAWRPTHGLVPVDGVFPLAPSFDTVGLFAAGDASGLLAIAADVLADGLSPAPAVAGVIVATDLLELVDAVVAAHVLAGAERLARTLEVPLVQREVLPVDPGVARDGFRTLQGGEAWRCHGELVSTGELDLGPGIAGRFAAAAQVTAAEEAAANTVRRAVRAALLAATAGGWIIAQPAARSPAPSLDIDLEAKAQGRPLTLALTSPAGLAGAPVVVVPLRPAGAPPLGLALVAAPNGDATALAAGQAMDHPT
jgi:Asp-tRNA(Asn)/Glu-tRNA(Gln) amidotransferase A subunit family amidase